MSECVALRSVASSVVVLTLPERWDQERASRNLLLPTSVGRGVPGGTRALEAARGSAAWCTVTSHSTWTPRCIYSRPLVERRCLQSRTLRGRVTRDACLRPAPPPPMTPPPAAHVFLWPRLPTGRTRTRPSQHTAPSTLGHAATISLSLSATANSILAARTRHWSLGLLTLCDLLPAVRCSLDSPLLVLVDYATVLLSPRLRPLASPQPAM